MSRSAAVLSAVLALSACAHEMVLEPAAGAALDPGRPSVAEDTVAGVTIKVTGDSCATGRESAVQFEMKLVDASDGQAFGDVAIPFQTAQD